MLLMLITGIQAQVRTYSQLVSQVEVVIFAFLAAFGFIDLRLGDSSGSVFSDTSLPLNLSLNDFDIRTLILRSGQPNDIKYQIDGEITALSVSAVPIPAAVWLFGSGIIGLIGVARRKKA